VCLSKPDKRVFIFIKDTEHPIEPQAALVLKLIKKLKVCTRIQLLHEMLPVVETNATVSKVLTFHQRTLIRCGCIEVKDFDEYVKTTKNVSMVISENEHGGYSIFFSDGAVVGNFESVEAANKTIQMSCI
jgi:hypothetical protein